MSTHSHAHRDTADTEPDWEAMAAHLEREAELRLAAMREAVSWLTGLLPLEDRGAGRDSAPAPRVLDVGSGPGVTAVLLAQSFPQAHVTAVDGAAGLLERARGRAAEHGLEDRIATQQAALPDDFDTLGPADLTWTSQVVHHVGDQQAALRSLAATLRPGGLLAVAERGLPARFLPRDIGLGRPGLQARLDAVQEDWFNQMRAELPGHTRTVEDWPGMLSAAGLRPAGSRTFLTDTPAPLTASARAYLQQQLARARENFAERLDAEDLSALDHLLDEESPEGVRNRRDVFYLSATTLHAAYAG